MNPKKIVDANKAITELSGIVLPYKAARAVVSLKRRLAEEFDMIADMEKTAIEKNGGKIDESGNVRFSDIENAKKFSEERTKFMNEEADIVLPEVDLSEYADQISLSPDSLSALENIVIFDREVS